MTDTPPPDGPPPSGSGATPPAPLVPEPRTAADGKGSRSLVTALALGVVGFGATLILLGGLASLVGRSEGRSAADASSTVTPATASAGPSGPVSSEPAPTASSVAGSPTAGPAGDPVLVGAGDIADCGLDGDSATAALLDTLDGTVFTAGDNVYPDGSPDQFRDCYGPTWGRHLARTRPAPGNHDWVTKDLAGYLGHFGAAAAPRGTSWYSYDLGRWHVIVLDSDCVAVGGCGPDSAQGRWLAADLGASTARCTVAIWHHPRFSSGEHGNDPSVAPFWSALYDAGADLIVNGHDHDYERFAPQDPDGREDRARGIAEIVVGTGGAALRGFPTVVPNSVVRASVAHGVVRFVLRSTGYEWRFISTTGEFSDSGQGTCH
jgi:hypothetical protein